MGLLVLMCLLQLTRLSAADNKIDTHSHFFPQFYRKILLDNNIRPGGALVPEWSASEHLEFMDKTNISLSTLSISTPGAVLREGYPVEESRKLARQLNEFGYMLSKEYPDRFRFLATLTLPDVEGSVAEAIYALDNLKAAGVVLLASSSGEVLGSPLWKPLYAELDKRNATVFVHPSQCPCPQQDETIDTCNTDVPAYVVDFLLDTTRAAFNLVLKNVTTDYPNVKFLLSHGGGFLPFAASRLAGGLHILASRNEEWSLAQLRRFYVDVALTANDFALPSILSLLSPTQITFGSDYPFARKELIMSTCLYLDAYIEQNLAPAALQQIDFDNAFRLFSHVLTEDSLRHCEQPLSCAATY